jgi:hypothetical protein
MNQKSNKASKPKFRLGKMSELEKEAARKASLDKSPQYPNRDMSMRRTQT